MPIVVQKYGGSSLETLEKINEVAKKIARKKADNFKIVIVLSAMGKTTDYLMDMAYRISKNPRKRELAVLMATGEQVSIALLSIAL